ncbi:MAG: NAD(P)/FAD-dependent oxidoreductase [Planctomycetota bacterium]|jgi:uncharacterized FAD-dependent dehydrogenase
MKIRVEQVVVGLDGGERDLIPAVASALSLAPSLVESVTVLRRSIDARPRRKEPVYVLVLEVELNDAVDLESMTPKGGVVVKAVAAPKEAAPPPVNTRKRVLVVGAGPAGLFAAHTLALAGWNPVLIERGEAAGPRIHTVTRFWREGVLDPESNALYGEGGAGTFSDGKLTTRSKDRERVQRMLKTLVDCGAEASIRIDAEPHLGSNRLPRIVTRLREEIVRLGGEIHFSTRLTDLQIENGVLRGVVVEGAKGRQEWACDACVLATGHSAREVYTLLHRYGVDMTAKPFGVGVRLEVPQEQIDQSQYGRFAGHPRLGAASFRLTRKGSGGIRNCYSFCMCPGGEVIACASEPGMLTTNGMSNAERSAAVGNAAFLVPVDAQDFGEGVMAGIEYQRRMEAAAYRAGEGYAVPAMRATDFVAGTSPRPLEHGENMPRTVLTDLSTILPEPILTTLRGSITQMLGRMKAVRLAEATIYGPETRSSAPVRIMRCDNFASTSLAGLYPAGEGAGAAGGIVSSALDGMRIAESILCGGDL